MSPKERECLRKGLHYRPEDDESLKERVISKDPDIQKFIDDHGTFIRHENWLLFKDGAQLEFSRAGHFGVQIPPPDNEFELAKVMHKYYQILARRAEDEFRSWRNMLLGRGERTLAHPTDADVEKLEELKTVASAARRRLRKAKQELTDVTPAWMNAKHEMDAREQQRKSKLRERVSRIDL